jgi:hypothetical protein
METLKVLMITASLLVYNASQLTAQSPDAILGEWYTVDSKSIVRFDRNSDSSAYNGKVIWISDKVDRENARKMNGITTAKNLVFNPGRKIYKGLIYIPKLDEYRKTEFELKGEQLQFTIKVGSITKHIVWTRKEN